MRIAILAHCHHPIAQPYSGGLEAHTGLVADGLARRGHDVTLFAKAGSRTRAQPAPGRAERNFGAPFARRRPVLDRAWPGGRGDHRRGRLRRGAQQLAQPGPLRGVGPAAMLTVLHTPATLARVNAVDRAAGLAPGCPARLRRGVDGDPRRTGSAGCRGRRRLRPQRHRPATTGRRAPGSGPEPDLAVWAARITPEKGLPIAIAAARAAGFRLAFGGPIANPAHFAARSHRCWATRSATSGTSTTTNCRASCAAGRSSSPRRPGRSRSAWRMVEAMACGTPAAALPRGAAAEIVSPRVGCWPPTTLAGRAGRGGAAGRARTGPVSGAASPGSARSCSTATKRC